MNQTNSQDESELEVVAPSALEALQRADADIAISTAKKFRRDVATSIKTVRELALRNPKIAARCNYAVPRGGKKIIGPSVHFARIVAHAWGNLRCGSRVIGCDRDNAHLQGVCHDLETNVALTTEMDWPVQAPHTDTPERWKDQMGLAKRGGAAVALRNAIFEALPMVLFEDIAEEAKLVAVGEGKTFEERRANCIAEFKKMGVTQTDIYRLLERGGLESITTDDLVYLHGVLTSLLDRTMTVAEVFGPAEARTVKAEVPKRGKKEEPPVDPEKGLDLAKKMKEEVAAGQKAEPPPPAPSPPAAAAEPASEEPFPEPKQSAAEAPPPPKAKKAAAAEKQQDKPKSDQADPLADIRARLVEAKVSEAELISWLNDIGTVPDGTTKLEQVNPKWLKMVVDDWQGILDQVTDFLNRLKA